MSQSLAAILRTWLADGTPAVRVVVRRALGSTPREAGASMLVSATQTCGTIGGGRLELDAILAARALLLGGGSEARWDVPLGPAIGQCCGGHVSLLAERADSRVLADLAGAEQAALPLVLLFGAGHVGHALARALSPLPLRVRWIDERPEAFGPAGGHVEQVVSTAWSREVETAAPGTACLVMTHSHSLDSLITAAALARGDLAYVGLIGSATKRRRFEHAFRDIGIAKDRIAALVCPIGDRGVRDKRPEVIAALTAAELVVAFARWSLRPAEAGRLATARPRRAAAR